MKEIKIVDNSFIKINGRVVKDNEAVHMFWTGSYIEFNIKATELYLLVEGVYSSLEHYIAIEINGMICQRIMLDGSKQLVPIFKFFGSNKITNVRIFKEVQAMSEDPSHILNIYSIKTDGELLPLQNKKLKLEFIGDSVNSGEGAIGTGLEDNWISHYFSHVRSYPYMVSKLLNADYRVFSKSGWGVHCSWDNNPECKLPNHYEYICSVYPKDCFNSLGIFEKYNFDENPVDAIICNLGTNDNSAFFNLPFVDKFGNHFKMRMNGNNYNEEDVEVIKNAIIDFLIKLRSNNRNSKIYWAYGILGNGLESIIKNAIDSYNTENKDSISYISLIDSYEIGYGAKSHPGIESHRKNAYLIANVLKRDFNIDTLNDLLL